MSDAALTIWISCGSLLVSAGSLLVSVAAYRRSDKLRIVSAASLISLPRRKCLSPRET